jgi:hypothetical protein
MDASGRLEFSAVKQHGMCLFVSLDRSYVARTRVLDWIQSSFANPQTEYAGEMADHIRKHVDGLPCTFSLYLLPHYGPRVAHP